MDNDSDSDSSIQEFGESHFEENEELKEDEEDEYIEKSDDDSEDEVEKLAEALEIYCGEVNEEGDASIYIGDINYELPILLNSNAVKAFLNGRKVIPTSVKDWCMSISSVFKQNPTIVYTLHEPRISFPKSLWIQTHMESKKSWTIAEKYQIKINYTFDVKILKINTKFIEGLYFWETPELNHENDLLTLTSGLNINVKGLFFKKNKD